MLSEKEQQQKIVIRKILFASIVFGTALAICIVLSMFSGLATQTYDGSQASLVLHKGDYLTVGIETDAHLVSKSRFKVTSYSNNGRYFVSEYIESTNQYKVEDAKLTPGRWKIEEGDNIETSLSSQVFTQYKVEPHLFIFSEFLVILLGVAIGCIIYIVGVFLGNIEVL